MTTKGQATGPPSSLSDCGITIGMLASQPLSMGPDKNPSVEAALSQANATVHQRLSQLDHEDQRMAGHRHRFHEALGRAIGEASMQLLLACPGGGVYEEVQPPNAGRSLRIPPPVALAPSRPMAAAAVDSRVPSKQ